MQQREGERGRAGALVARAAAPLRPRPSAWSPSSPPRPPGPEGVQRGGAGVGRPPRATPRAGAGAIAPSRAARAPLAPCSTPPPGRGGAGHSGAECAVPRPRRRPGQRARAADLAREMRGAAPIPRKGAGAPGSERRAAGSSAPAPASRPKPRAGRRDGARPARSASRLGGVCKGGLICGGGRGAPHPHPGRPRGPRGLAPSRRRPCAVHPCRMRAAPRVDHCYNRRRHAAGPCMGLSVHLRGPAAPLPARAGAAAGPRPSAPPHPPPSSAAPHRMLLHRIIQRLAGAERRAVRAPGRAAASRAPRHRAAVQAGSRLPQSPRRRRARALRAPPPAAARAARRAGALVGRRRSPCRFGCFGCGPPLLAGRRRSVPRVLQPGGARSLAAAGRAPLRPPRVLHQPPHPPTPPGALTPQDGDGGWRRRPSRVLPGPLTARAARRARYWGSSSRRRCAAPLQPSEDRAGWVESRWGGAAGTRPAAPAARAPWGAPDRTRRVPPHRALRFDPGAAPATSRDAPAAPPPAAQRQDADLQGAAPRASAPPAPALVAPALWSHARCARPIPPRSRRRPACSRAPP
jgi:hypothetical protein